MARTKITGPQLAGIDYSTEETLTGAKWIDGSPIYKKTVNFGAMPNNTTKDVAHGITGIEDVIDYEAIARSTSNFFPLPFTRTGGLNSMELRISTTNIRVTTTSADFTSYNAYVTLYYTK